MAPNRGSSSSKEKSSKAKSKPLSSASKVTKSSAKAKAKKAKQQLMATKEVKPKSRSAPDQLKKTKKREYTEDELDLPKLNMITPVGVQKPKKGKKGKAFVDDQVGFFFLKPDIIFFIFYFLLTVSSCRRA